MNKHRDYRQKTAYVLITLLTFLAITIARGGWAHAAQPTLSSANSAEELFLQMMDAEYAVYEEAEQTALEFRLKAYKYYMNQNLDETLEDRTPHMKMLHHIAKLYGRLLKLRTETIIETKRRWPDEPVDEQIDMLSYQPKLISDIMDNLAWMVTIDMLGLSWEQKKAVLAKWHQRDMVRMNNNHQIDLHLIDMKATLSKKIPGIGWVDESVESVVALYDEIINESKLNYNETWLLLSPEQRVNLRELTFVSFRSQ